MNSYWLKLKIRSREEAYEYLLNVGYLNEFLAPEGGDSNEPILKWSADAWGDVEVNKWSADDTPVSRIYGFMAKQQSSLTCDSEWNVSSAAPEMVYNPCEMQTMSNDRSGPAL